MYRVGRSLVSVEATKAESSVFVERGSLRCLIHPFSRAKPRLSIGGQALPGVNLEQARLLGRGAERFT